MNKYLKPLLLVILSLAALQSYAAEAPRDPSTYFFNETFGDFSEELANAKAQGKQGVMLFFEMDECPFCHWMKVNVLNQPEVQKYYREHFLMFPVDIEGDVEITDFAGKTTTQKNFAVKNRVRATPVIAFFDLNGKLVHRHTGRTADVQEFMLMGRYVAEGKYKQMRFTKFKRENRN